MAWTRTDIANQALQRLGINKTITDVDTDTSSRASALRESIDLAIDSVNSAFPWPLSKRVEVLTLVSGSASSPYSNDWTCAYQYPTYAKKLLGIVAASTSQRFETDADRTEYQTISHTSGRLLLTDLEDASAVILVLPEEGYYPAMYVEAVALKLAMLAGPALKGEAKAEVDLSAQYVTILSEAKVIAANEAGFERQPDTPSVRARRGGIRRGGELDA